LTSLDLTPRRFFYSTGIPATTYASEPIPSPTIPLTYSPTSDQAFLLPDRILLSRLRPLDLSIWYMVMFCFTATRLTPYATSILVRAVGCRAF